MDEKIVKDLVKEKYAEIAAKTEKKCCCGSSKIIDYTIMKEDYSKLEGYLKDADLDLGCGLPTEFAGIRKGDTVVDLGSGAGNDVFVARALIGNEGKVIGIDFTEEMIKKAEQNKSKLGFDNVEFHLGEIENIPIEDETADVVISNCVLNLVPDKVKAFKEIFRITKKGGHFCVSDIVLKGELPSQLKKSAEMYAGCVAGALQQEEYLSIIKEVGFTKVEIKKTKVISLPEEILKKYLHGEALEKYKQNETGIFSITVVAEKS